MVVTPPFVVIGDEPPADVRRRAENTVKWAVTKLKKAYFARDPKEILDIWLFKDKESYEKNAKKLFGKTPDTPYGYFSEQDKALVMNISTGGGTLVHEIVHPFVAANFPHCPAWFNEGLGSLYEQSGEVDGEIHGYTNWRLPGLAKGDSQGKTAFVRNALPHDRHGVLRERPRHELRPGPLSLLLFAGTRVAAATTIASSWRTATNDPTGYKTLKAVLRRDDMGKFQKEWEAFVLKLRFPDGE